MSKFTNKEQKNKENSGNIYDRIFRENAQTIFIPLVQAQLNIDITRYEPLAFKMARTREREVDFLYKIFDKKGKESILHLEFQTRNDREMLARIQEYHGLIYRKYKLPIRHIVIYLGKPKSTMKNKLKPSLIFTGFDIINITEIDPNKLISTQVPEMIILALLGNIKKDRVDKVLNDIVEKLKSLIDSEDLIAKYMNQLLILARIRNFQLFVEQKLNDMPISYDVEKDSLYLRGVEKGVNIGREQGKEEGREEAIANSVWKLFKAGQSINFIAETLELSALQVKKYIKIWEEKS